MIDLEPILLWHIYMAALAAQRQRQHQKLARRVWWQDDVAKVRDRLAELGLTL